MPPAFTTTFRLRPKPDGAGVDLVFRGTPRMFIGTVGVDGAKGGTMNAQLQRASQLSPGTRFTQAKLSNALEQMRQTMAENGFHEPEITPTLTPHPDQQLVDISFAAVSGAQARVGKVQVSGDPGMSAVGVPPLCPLENRRSRGPRHRQPRPHPECSNTTRVKIAWKLKSRSSPRNTTPPQKPSTSASRPIGDRWSKSLCRARTSARSASSTSFPSIEEGSVDEDLLNEGNRRLRDYYQRLGYFDVKVNHEQHIRRRAAKSSSSSMCSWASAAACRPSPSPEITTSTPPRSRNCSAFMPPIRSIATAPTARPWWPLTSARCRRLPQQRLLQCQNHA